MQKILFYKLDNSPLIIFRIIFGLLIILESWGAILTGWVHKTLIAPKFTFNFINLDFLQPLPGNGMYWYFAIMGCLGIGVMLGYRYKLSIISFTILWTTVYLMQKSSYNNHYYLLCLISTLMCFLPANKNLSLDVKYKHTTKSDWMPSWIKWLIIGQLFIVYTYASIAKFYPDWLDATVASNLMARKKHFFLVGELLQQKWIHYTIAYFGIIFDGLIIPVLLYKKTRKFAFIFIVFFHLYNSFVLHIGIFPYLALAFCLFFFEPELIRKIFYPKSKKVNTSSAVIFKPKLLVTISIGIWLLVQSFLPLRHWIIPGDVLWTEEGHRLSWRMMLRSKSGYNKFYINEVGINSKKKINLKEYLTSKQIRAMSGKPDMIWQFAQHLKKEFEKKGQQIEVHVINKTRVNGSSKKSIINYKTDLANVKWNYWKHNDWIVIDQ